MTRRTVDPSIWSNEHFALLQPMARLLQIGIITMADDQGRLKAHPAYLRSQIFPYDDVQLCDVEGWLDAMVRNGTIQVYTVEGKAYLQLLKWWDYQSLSFAWPSILPRVEGWHDRLRFTKNGTTYTCNWISARGECLADTCNENGNPVSRNGVPPTPKGDNPHGSPHGNPSDNPHGSPHEPSNLTKLNTNLTKKQQQPHAGACEEAAAAAAVFPNPESSEVESEQPEPLAVAEFQRAMGREPKTEERQGLAEFATLGEPRQVFEAFSALSAALKKRTRIRDPVAYARQILADIVADAATPKPSFGLQSMNGTMNHATDSSTPRGDEQPTPEQIAAFRESNRRMAVQAAARAGPGV